MNEDDSYGFIGGCVQRVGDTRKARHHLVVSAFIGLYRRPTVVFRMKDIR
jgi:hypothetical protein